jgi:hypothetical protein
MNKFAHIKTINGQQMLIIADPAGTIEHVVRHENILKNKIINVGSSNVESMFSLFVDSRKHCKLIFEELTSCEPFEETVEAEETEV